MKRKSKKQLGNLEDKIKAAIINDLAAGMSKREVANKYSVDIGKIFIVADHSKDEIAAIRQQKEDEMKKAAEEEQKSSGMIINNIELISDDIEILDDGSKEKSNPIQDKEKTETPKNPEEDKSKKDLGVVVIGRKILTRDIIIQIVNDLKAGMDQTSVAIRHNFSIGTVSRVKRVEIDHAYGIYKDYPYSRIEEPDEETKKIILDNMAKGIKPPQYISKGPHSVRGTRNPSQLNPKEEKKEATTIPVNQQQSKENIKPVEDKKEEQIVNKVPSTDETVYKTGSIVTNVAPVEKKHPNESTYGDEFTLLRKHTCVNVGLVADRHAQPVRDYVFKSIDSATMFNYDKLDKMAEAWIRENIKFNDGCAESSVACYTTGLQCALASFIKACYKFKVNLVLMHYNAENQKYLKQEIFIGFEYKTRENESICPEKLLEAARYSRHLYAFKSIDDIVSQDIIYEVVEVYYNSSRAQLFTDTVLFADKADAWFYFMEKSEEKTKNKSMFINVVDITGANYKKTNNLAKKTS